MGTPNEPPSWKRFHDWLTVAPPFAMGKPVQCGGKRGW